MKCYKDAVEVPGYMSINHHEFTVGPVAVCTNERI